MKIIQQIDREKIFHYNKTTSIERDSNLITIEKIMALKMLRPQKHLIDKNVLHVKLMHKKNI